MTNTGKELEKQVADAYRQMGARTVKHDVELVGNQIDVYVELETHGRHLHRIAVEVKDWARSVGIDVVNGFAAITQLLRQQGRIDEGVIVSASGFSKQARNAAETYDITLLEPADLETPGTIGQAAREPPSTTPPSPRLPSELFRQRPSNAVQTSDRNLSSKPHRTASLDSQILRILHDYLRAYPGDHKMSINELVDALGSKRDDIIPCLLGLQEKGWVAYDLTEGAEVGLVWLTRRGIKVAQDIK